jgi:hypothetical protein
MECNGKREGAQKIWMNSHKPSKCFNITFFESIGGEVFPCFALSVSHSPEKLSALKMRNEKSFFWTIFFSESLNDFVSLVCVQR